MKAALLACLLALPGFAQDAGTPADAPIQVQLTAGQPAPFTGLLLTDAHAIDVANAVADGQSRVSLKVVVIAAGICLLGGAALGFAIARTAK